MCLRIKEVRHNVQRREAYIGVRVPCVVVSLWGIPRRDQRVQGRIRSGSESIGGSPGEDKGSLGVDMGVRMKVQGVWVRTGGSRGPS